MSRSSMLKSMLGFFHRRLLLVLVQVVAEHGDVEDAQGHVDLLQFLDQLLDAAGDVDAPGLDADQHQLLRLAVALQDLDGQALEACASSSYRP